MDGNLYNISSYVKNIIAGVIFNITRSSTVHFSSLLLTRAE